MAGRLRKYAWSSAPDWIRWFLQDYEQSRSLEHRKMIRYIKLKIESLETEEGGQQMPVHPTAKPAQSTVGQGQESSGLWTCHGARGPMDRGWSSECPHGPDPGAHGQPGECLASDPDSPDAQLGHPRQVRCQYSQWCLSSTTPGTTHWTIEFT